MRTSFFYACGDAKATSGSETDVFATVELEPVPNDTDPVADLEVLIGTAAADSFTLFADAGFGTTAVHFVLDGRGGNDAFEGEATSAPIVSYTAIGGEGNDVFHPGYAIFRGPKTAFGTNAIDVAKTYKDTPHLSPVTITWCSTRGKEAMAPPDMVIDALRLAITNPSLANARRLESALRNAGYPSRLFGRMNQKSSIHAVRSPIRAV